MFIRLTQYRHVTQTDRQTQRERQTDRNAIAINSYNTARSNTARCENCLVPYYFGQSGTVITLSEVDNTITLGLCELFVTCTLMIPLAAIDCVVCFLGITLSVA